MIDELMQIEQVLQQFPARAERRRHELDQRFGVIGGDVLVGERGAKGVRVRVIEAAHVGVTVPECDLVIDAAFGTGFRGQWVAPDPGRAEVLAGDIPSGVDGLTGRAPAGVLRADRTIVLAALKPGADGAM